MTLPSEPPHRDGPRRVRLGRVVDPRLLKHATAARGYMLAAVALSLTAGRTTRFITHDMARLECLDEIVVQDRGKVAQRGTHEQVMRAGGPLPPALGGPGLAQPCRPSGERNAETSRATSVARKIWPVSASRTATACPPLYAAV